MSKSYTPGLKILKNTKILKERRLPLKGDINCKVGDKVGNSAIVASTFIPGNIHMVNVINQLNIDAQSIKDYLTVKIDDLVKKDDIIAENKGMFGFFKTQVKSPIEGKISNISSTTGQIMISEPDIPVEINAYIDGKIIDIIENEGVIIESEGTFVQGIIGVGGEKNGIIHSSFGKTSFEKQDLIENVQMIYESLMKARPASAKGQFIKKITLSSTMGPGIKVDLTSIRL